MIQKLSPDVMKMLFMNNLDVVKMLFMNNLELLKKYENIVISEMGWCLAHLIPQGAVL